MKPKKLHLIAAARPNFMKIAPLFHALKGESWAHPVIVHTGQHYDANMSTEFIHDLNLPAPEVHLGVGSGTHAEQTGGVMTAYEQVCIQEPPDWVIVAGDVNSTLACALTAKKLLIPVAHLEAGLRSNDRTMPEEINRLCTDAISDLLWTPSEDADENLRREGIPQYKIIRVGNIMIDSFTMLRSEIAKAETWSDYDLQPCRYGVLTLHRPVNVDQKENLSQLVTIMIEVSHLLPLIFPVHPRTVNRLQNFGLLERLQATKRITLCSPLGYVRFMSLVQQAALVITDSGGVQEETTFLQIPCLTLRETTERPVTVTEGTNCLIKAEELIESVGAALQGHWKKGRIPEFWDGHTAERVVKSLKSMS